MTHLCPPPSLSDLFPAGAMFAVAPPGTHDGDRFPAEQATVANAIESRRREFASGRALARQQLARLGIEPGPIPANDDRTPVWPAGIVGSISHCADLVAVVVARSGAFRSLGLDVEPDEPLEQALWSIIATPTELSRIRVVDSDARGRLIKRLFVAKEATYKCLYPITRTSLEFSNVEITFDDDHFRASPSPDSTQLWTPLRGRLLAGGPWLFGAVVWPVKNT